MALQKDYICPNGATGNYIRVYPEPNSNRIRVEIYLNQSTRDDNTKTFLYDTNYYVNGDIFSEANQKLPGKSKFVLAYDYLKTLPEFLGAVDV